MVIELDKLTETALFKPDKILNSVHFPFLLDDISCAKIQSISKVIII